VKRLLYSIVLFLAYNELAQAQDGLAQLRISTTKTEVLAGRMLLSVPDPAKSRAIQRGIMAAPESDSEQTRIMIDAGEQRMVLMVYELFARTDVDDLQGQAEKATRHFPMKASFRKWPLTAPLRAVAYFPAVPTKNEDANFVMGVFVASPDGSVRNFMWYVNPQAASQFEADLKLAESMAETIAPGTKTLDTSGGERELSAYSKTKSVVASIPKGYALTTQQGPDFIVHHINKMVSFGDEKASIGVYLGDHPSNNRDGFVGQGKATLFGKSVTWYQRVDHEGGTELIMDDATVPLAWSVLGRAVPGTGDGPSYADVFLTAASASGILELKSIASTFRLADRNAH
jgi:hypothetical protein